MANKTSPVGAHFVLWIMRDHVAIDWRCLLFKTQIFKIGEISVYRDDIVLSGHNFLFQDVICLPLKDFPDLTAWNIT